MVIDQETFNELVDFLVPFVETERERQSLIHEAFVGIKSKPSIDYSGTSHEFCVHLIRRLDNYGQIKKGIYALEALLEAIEKQVGVDKQEKILDFKTAINISSYEPQTNIRIQKANLSLPEEYDDTSLLLYEALIKQLPPLPKEDISPSTNHTKSKIIRLEDVQRSVGINGGTFGNGTGFFISYNGLIATSLNCVGVEKEVEVALLDGRRLEGRVMYSFPNLDLAFVKAEVRLDRLLSIREGTSLPLDTYIIAVTHSGFGLRSRVVSLYDNPIMQTRISTFINHILDTGGNPVFAGEHNWLIGMLTSQKTAKGYYYVLPIEIIYETMSRHSIEF
jgi:hypothetical protein